MNTNFSQRLKLLRIENNLSQIELAKALTITQRRVSYLEQGQTEPDLELLNKLCDFFDVSADFILGRKDF